MKPSYLMALDAGGGGGHCLLVELASQAMLRAHRSWQHRPAAGTGGMGAELDLESVWARLCEAAHEAMERAGATPDRVLAVAATSMRHTTVVLDAEGGVLLAAPNRDARALGEALQLAAEQGDEIYARTGHWPVPILSALRLRWLASHDPESWQRAATHFSLSDWITWRLCGEIASEPSQASATLLFDLEAHDWSPELVERLGIPRRLLPPLRVAGSRIGLLGDAAARELGLRSGTPVAVGGSDTQCGLLGAGCVAPGQAAAIGGTTVPVQLVTAGPRVDPKGRLWTECHVLPERWILESNAGSMGHALEWIAGALFPESASAVARLLAEADRSTPGAAGVLSTLGTRVMHARELSLPVGSLSLSHLAHAGDPDRRRHLARAVVEGMACGVRANLAQLVEVAEEPSSFAFAGGLSRSEPLAQLLCDVLGRPLVIGATREATALGAAFCAGVAAGVFPDLIAASQAFEGRQRTLHPDPERSDFYQSFFGGWDKLRAERAESDATAAQLVLPEVLAGFRDASGAAEPATRPRIFVSAEMDEASLAELRALGDVEYASFRKELRLLTGSALRDALAGVQVFVTEVDVIDAQALRELPDLRVVAACRGDVVNVDLEACTVFGIPVLGTPGRNAEAVADLTLGFLLMLARKLPQACAFLRQPGIEAGDMGRMGQAFQALQGRELWHKTVGLVGLGAVGRAVARRLPGFGAQLLICDPHLPPEAAVLAGGEPVSLDELLARSDFVSLHAALNQETRGLLGAAQLGRMKAGACLVNTARAGLVDEAALLDALGSGQLAGAALDVFAVEPPGSEHPLLALENVIATPHVGGNTVDVASHQGQLVAADLRRLLCGERPQSVQNPEALADFAWEQPRRTPDAATLEALARRAPPAVTDLQQAPAPAKPRAAAALLPAPVREKMERILAAFLERIAGDEALARFASDKDVTLRFSVPDLGLRFYFRMAKGAVSARLGDPERPPEVDLKMSAWVLDGMFTGRVNPMQEAMGGRLSFSGDTVKAMTLQQIQADLSRLYGEARDQVGEPGELSVPAEASAAGPRPPLRAAAGDLRSQLTQIVAELFSAGLITATGGNASVRVPGKDELWITPSQSFKGDLRPELLVRLDLDGNTLDPDALSPSSERLMHCAVYRLRPEAQAVIHAHAPYATLLANTELPFLPISTEAAFFGEIPRIPFIMPGTQELAEAVEEALRDNWAVLMQNHGLLVAGRSLRRTADMVEVIERSAALILGSYVLQKKPPVLPDEIVRVLQGMGELMA